MILIFVVWLANSRIIITEVMSNVKGSENPYGDRNEFVEIYNQSPDTVDLSTYKLSDFDAASDDICEWNNDSILLKYPAVRIMSTLLYPHSYALIMDREYIYPDSINGQPYGIPGGTLILTTDDTSIGDGLSSNDPIIVYSISEACTTSFGTPFTQDNFPSDPGDGMSWELIDYSLPDTATNWHPCINSSGCTPGMENSVTNAFDLALDQNLISFVPAKVQAGEDVNISIGVINNGLRPTADYTVSIYDDRNKDSLLDISELLCHTPGELVGSFDTVFLYWTYKKPSQEEHRLGLRIDFDQDRNLTNNTVFKSLQVLGTIGELSLNPSIFTPNNDGQNDLLQIDYRLPEPGGKLTITIYNSRGVKVVDLCRKKPIDNAKGTLYWDGETADKLAPTGMYIVYLEYQYGNKNTKAKKTAILAR